MKFDLLSSSSVQGEWLRLTPETDAESWQLRVVRQKLDRADMRSNLEVTSDDKPATLLICLTNEE